MKSRQVETRKGTRCRVLEGGSGAPLLFLHGAGGLLADNPFLDELAKRYAVFAPEWPGYGESTGEDLLEDMLTASNAPPLTLVLSFRDDPFTTSAARERLLALVERDDRAFELFDVPVPFLSEREAEELARSLLDRPVAIAEDALARLEAQVQPVEIGVAVLQPRDDS